MRATIRFGLRQANRDAAAMERRPLASAAPHASLAPPAASEADGIRRPVAPRFAFVLAAAVGALATMVPRDAAACGACYAASSESTVVSDHQMALSISKQRTILWDQIQYSGNPKEFAYVLPAKPGTRIEPSNESWFTSLEASTRPIIMAPPQRANGVGGGGSNYFGDDEGGGGCTCGPAAADALSASAGGSADASAGAPAPEPVAIVEQAVVGPYETVTLRSDDPEALTKWLVAHGYAVPEISAPIIAEYVKNGFDFIALRLAPGANVRKIEPIRIVSPGADLTLPLRLMQIGAGTKVGVTLYVIGEGRYKTKNFPDAPIDFGELFWDYNQSRSNYQELLQRAMATGDGRAFVTEYANKPSLDDTAPLSVSGLMGNPPLAAQYASSCATYDAPRPDAGPNTTEPDDGGADAMTSNDAGSDEDGGDEDGGAGEPPDAGETPDARPKQPIVRATVCDDLEVALDGMAKNDVWITRMRASLPNQALAETLLLEPAAQTAVDNVHQTKAPGAITASVSPHHAAPWQQGTYALIAGTVFAVSRLLRRRRSSP